MNLFPIRVVHLDDNALDIRNLKRVLEEDSVAGKFILESYLEVSEFKRRIEKGSLPDLLLLDIDLNHPGMNGISLAKEFRAKFPSLIIVLLSILEDIQTITGALAAGADDFISKTSDSNHLSFRLHQAFHLARLKKGGLPQETTGCETHSLRKAPKIVGQTLSTIRSRIPLLCSSAVSAIYVEGESGTGKEVVADLIESFLSPEIPFIRVNCAEIAPTLLESELFGYTKGSFTGAMQNKQGLFEASHGGWIFLDEVSMLSAPAQAALLRTLESKQIRKLGDTKPKLIDFKLISASNEPIEELVRVGRFRLDLWQRIREAEIKLPPLRERPEEIKDLIRHFCETLVGGPYEMTLPAIRVLSQYSWTEGNVRQLRNTVKAMTEFKIDQLLTPLSIPDNIWQDLQGAYQTHLKPQLEKKEAEIFSKSQSCGKISVPYSDETPISFNDLSDLLFLEIYRNHREMAIKNNKKQSLRLLAKKLQIARSTVSITLRRLKEKKLIQD